MLNGGLLDRIPEENKYLEHFNDVITDKIDKFAIDIVFKDCRYLFVEKKVDKYLGYCTHCNAEYEVMNLKHNENVICPNCKSELQVKLTRYGRKGLQNYACFLTFDKSMTDKENTIVARGFYAKRDYSDDYKNVKTRYKEIGRYIYSPKESVMLRNRYYWDLERKKWDKCCSIGKYNIDGLSSCPSYVDVGSFRTAIAGTRFKYSPYRNYTYNLTNFLEVYNKYPLIESLEKMGFTKLVQMKVSKERMGRVLNWRAKDIFKLLKLNRAEVKEIQSENIKVTPNFLTFYREAKEKKYKLTIKEIEESESILNHYGTSEKTKEEIEKYTTWTKAFRYISKQNENKSKSKFLDKVDTLRTWKDYISDCEKLKLDLTKSITLFPRNLYKQHQNTIKQIKYQEDKELEEELKKYTKIREKFNFEYKNLFIRAAKDQKELIAEGDKLHHCVGGYAKRHCKGQTNILFIRKKDEPDKPFYTLEVSNSDEVVQVRGIKNIEPTEEVKELMKAFEKEKLNKKKSKKVA